MLVRVLAGVMVAVIHAPGASSAIFVQTLPHRPHILGNLQVTLGGSGLGVGLGFAVRGLKLFPEDHLRDLGQFCPASGDQPLALAARSPVV